MCALFGQGVTIQQAALDLGSGQTSGVELDIEARSRLVPLLAANVVQPALGVPVPAVRAQALETPAPAVLSGPSLTLVPDSLATHGLGGAPFLLSSTVSTVPADPPPILREDTAFMRGRPVLRRGIPANRLSEDQATYWIKRLADAKRLNARHIKLVAVFPDMQLDADRPVSYRPEEDALAFTLPAAEVKPSNVVVARHALTGESIQARFYRE